MAATAGTTLQSSPTLIISPIAVSYAPEAFINVDSELLAAVEVQGIQQQFEIDLSTVADVKALLEGFDVSGALYDTRLSDSSDGPVQIVDADLSALEVTMTADAVKKAAMRAVIEKGINEALDASGKVVDRWLADRLNDAFKAAFGSYLPTGWAEGQAPNPVNETSPTDQTQTPGTTNGGTGMPVGDVTTSIAITSGTEITGYAVDVLTDASNASADFWTAHENATQNFRNFIFRQVPQTNIKAYLPAGAAGISPAAALKTKALPLVEGNAMAFIFDVDLSNAGANPGAAGDEDVPVAIATGSATAGQSSFALNLGMRRITIQFNLTATADGLDGAADEAVTYNLVGNDNSLTAPANPAEGVNGSGSQ
jgi:hypothetical protein